MDALDMLKATTNDPDVRAGRLHFRVFQDGEVLLARVLQPSGIPMDELDAEDAAMVEGALFTCSFPTFGEAVDAMERESEEQGVWYGQPEWLRQPDFELRIMAPSLGG